MYKKIAIYLSQTLAVSIAIIGLLVAYTTAPAYAQAKETSLKNSQEIAKKLSLFPEERKSLSDFRNYVSNFYLFSIGAGILVAVMLMMIGGMIWLTSAGNQGRVSKAQEYIINAIIGVVLLLGSYTIIQAINPRLVNLEDPNLPKIPAFGSCLSSGAPKTTSLANATHTCTLGLKEDCKEGSAFDQKKSCEQVCKQYVSDGGCSLTSPVVTRSAEVDAVNNTATGACTYTRLSNGEEICIEVREAQCKKAAGTSEPSFERGGRCPGNEDKPEDQRCINITGEVFYGQLGFHRLTPKLFINASSECLEGVCKPKGCEVNTAADLHPNTPYTLSCTCKDPA